MSDSKTAMPASLSQIDFLDDGNAVMRWSDGRELLIMAEDVPEEVLRHFREQREWQFDRSLDADLPSIDDVRGILS